MPAGQRAELFADIHALKEQLQQVGKPYQGPNLSAKAKTEELVAQRDELAALVGPGQETATLNLGGATTRVKVKPDNSVPPDNKLLANEQTFEHAHRAQAAFGHELQRAQDLGITIPNDLRDTNEDWQWPADFHGQGGAQRRKQTETLAYIGRLERAIDSLQALQRAPAEPRARRAPTERQEVTRETATGQLRETRPGKRAREVRRRREFQPQAASDPATVDFSQVDKAKMLAYLHTDGVAEQYSVVTKKAHDKEVQEAKQAAAATKPVDLGSVPANVMLEYVRRPEVANVLGVVPRDDYLPKKDAMATVDHNRIKGQLEKRLGKWQRGAWVSGGIAALLALTMFFTTYDLKRQGGDSATDNTSSASAEAESDEEIEADLVKLAENSRRIREAGQFDE